MKTIVATNSFEFQLKKYRPLLNSRESLMLEVMFLREIVAYNKLLINYISTFFESVGDHDICFNFGYEGVVGIITIQVFVKFDKMSKKEKEEFDFKVKF